MYIEYFRTRDSAQPPRRANPSDAGMDLAFAPESGEAVVIEPGDSAICATGLKFGVPHGYMLQIMNRSSVAANRSLVVGACVVDAGYNGEVFINLHNIGDVLLRQGEMERAYQYFDESLELARALGWLGGQAMNQVYLGFLQEWWGEEGGTLVLEEAIEDAKTSGVSDAVAQGKVFLARLAERRGDQELCDSLLVEAEALGTSWLVDLGAWNALSAEANGGSPGHRPPDPVA